MRKFLIAAVVGGLALVGVASPASATTKVKVTVCHWANGHPHPITVDANATGLGNIQGGHGELELNAGVFVSFVPKDVPGHEEDFIIKVGDVVVSTKPCGPQGPPGTPGENGKTPIPVCITATGGIYFLFERPEALPAGHAYITAETPCVALKGDPGAPGADSTVPGPKGDDGDDGPQGPAGPAGPTGPAGPQGPAGNDGAAGPTGPAGAAGPAGANGSDGAAGPAGSNGESVVTPAPAAGPAPTQLPRTGGNASLTALAAFAILLGGLATFMSRLIRKDAAQA